MVLGVKCIVWALRDDGFDILTHQMIVRCYAVNAHMDARNVICNRVSLCVALVFELTNSKRKTSRGLNLHVLHVLM